MNNFTFFVDLDGVLVDFVGGVCDIFDLNPALVKRDWPVGDYDVVARINSFLDVEISANTFWGEIERKDSFWENLLPLEIGFNVLDELRKLGDICLLTAPTLDPNCCAGKTRWIQKWFGKN